MGRSLSMTDARDQLTRLPDELAQSHETLTITRHGKPVLAVLPWELFEALLETLEVLGDPEMMAALRRSQQDIAAGRVKPLDQVFDELGW